MLMVAVGFTCRAQDNKAVNNIRKSLTQQVIVPMRKTATDLERRLTEVQGIYDRLKDRKYTSPDDLKDYLNDLTFDEMFDELDPGTEEWKSYVRKAVEDSVANAPESEFKRAYLRAFAMKKSLNVPYNKETNERFITDAAEIKGIILPAHAQGFEELADRIDDYNYYMFELSRLFVAADEDKYCKRVEILVKDEEAEELLKVPYTAGMLRMYLKKKGQLTPAQKAELKQSCPEAFPDY